MHSPLTMFIAAWFIIAKIEKQPNCPSIDEWLKKVYMCVHTHTYTPEYYSVIKKKDWNNAICSNVDGTKDYHTKWNKSEGERQLSYDVTYMWNLKYDTYKFIYESQGPELSLPRR